MNDLSKIKTIRPSSITWEFELDVSMFECIISRDKRESKEPLYTILLEISGIHEIEYDSHFGPIIKIVCDLNVGVGFISELILDYANGK